MKRIWMLSALAAASLAARNPPPPADSLHRQQSFVLRLDAPAATVIPLFGPVREAEWSPEWKPQFVYPAVADQVEGAVFVTRTHTGEQRFWVMTAYDQKQGRIEYVVITPGVTASQIRVQVSPEGDDKSRATVTYQRTALDSEGMAEVEKLDPAWADQQRAHWEAAINEALSRRQSK